MARVPGPGGTREAGARSPASLGAFCCHRVSPSPQLHLLANPFARTGREGEGDPS